MAAKGQQLTLGSEVLFPLGAVVSLIDTSGDGLTVEAAFVGFEGMLSLGPVRNIKAEVQVAGESLSMSRASYEDFRDNREFRRLTDSYSDRLLGLAFQSSVCLVSHRSEQRMATCLLAMMDRSGHDRLEMTHEYLGALLGVTRPTVTIAARVLQTRGLIHYRYGHVTIEDTAGLEQAACPCLAEIRHGLML